MVALDPPVDPVLLRYVNRLSDLLFVMARVANHRGGVPRDRSGSRIRNQICSEFVPESL